MVHFLAINNIGKGLSGGDSIWINLLLQWREYTKVCLWCCEDALMTLVSSHKPRVDAPFTPYFCITKFSVKNKFSKWGIFKNTIVKLFIGVEYVCKHLNSFCDGDIVYSVSDFYPDFVLGLLIKLMKPKVKWVAGFYLFAPPPWSSTYRRDRLRGWFYWLSQRISYPIIKRFADVVFVTSDIDKDKFPRTVVVRGGV